VSDKKPFHKNILAEMQELAPKVLVSSGDEKLLMRFGNLLPKSILPNKDAEIAEIVDSIRDMEQRLSASTDTESAKNYLRLLAEKIHTEHLVNKLVDLFVETKDVEFKKKDRSKIVAVGGSYSMFQQPITGRTPDGKDVSLYLAEVETLGEHL